MAGGVRTAEASDEAGSELAVAGALDCLALAGSFTVRFLWVNNISRIHIVG